MMIKKKIRRKVLIAADFRCPECNGHMPRSIMGQGKGMHVITCYSKGCRYRDIPFKIPLVEIESLEGEEDIKDTPYSKSEEKAGNNNENFNSKESDTGNSTQT